MKKYKVLLFVFLIVLLISGCENINKSEQNENLNESKQNENSNESKQDNKDSMSGKIDINRILEIDSGQYNSDPSLKHQSVIHNTPVYTIDNDVIAEKELKLGNNEYVFKYKETLYYPIGNFSFHEYTVDGDEKKRIFLDNNGNITTILYDYAFLDISKTESPEDVLEKLKIELSEVVDVSFYSEVEIPKPSSDPNEFHSYAYRFFNKENGYVTDYLMAFVKDNGAVCGVRVRNIQSKDFFIDIDKEKEHEAIELKLKSIFDTDTTDYLSYKMRFDPIITYYEKEYYVRYFVSTRYLENNSIEINSYIFEILIPLDMINTPSSPTATETGSK